MKIIIIVRHAKSSWEFDVIDHERPLKYKGHKDAHLVSKEFNTLSQPVDLLLCSDAIRTKLTSEIFISNLNLDKRIVHYNHDLYDFSGENLIKVIKNCDDSISNLMVFGHNHAITAFVNNYGSVTADSY